MATITLNNTEISLQQPAVREVSATQASVLDRGVYPEHVEGLISDPIWKILLV